MAPARTALRLAVLVPALLAFADVARAHGIATDGPGPTTTAGREGPVRLVSQRVTVRLADGVARVDVEETFRCGDGVPDEGTYLFPVPDGASVSRFELTVGDRTMRGEVLEASEARRVYEGIVRARRDPGLLEWVGRGLLRARVFPLQAGRDVVVRLAYEEVLAAEAGTLAWRFPLDVSRLQGRPADQSVVDVTIESASGLGAILSPTHAVAVERDGERRARATYEGGAATPRGDFLLYVGMGAAGAGLTLLSHLPEGEDGTFLAVIAPGADPRPGDVIPRSVAFVLDTSGSMEGEKLAQAKEALVAGIRGLRAADRFAVLAFSSAVRAFRDRAVGADEAAKAQAIAWVEALAADGGTDIGGALDAALRSLPEDGLPLVVLLTDGRPTVGVTDREALVKRAAPGASPARVHTFGLGYDLDVALLDRLAEATGGSRDYVAPHEEVASATGRFFRRVDRPVWTDVAVDLPEGVYDVLPRRIGDLYAGEQVVLLGRYREPGGKALRLTGRDPRGVVVREMHGAFRGAPGETVLPRLWAQRKVAFLLDAVRLHGESPEVVSEIVSLATRHGIVTPYTASLAVEDGAPRLASANPLSPMNGPTTPTPARGGGHGGQYRGPSGVVPPGLREPTDPTPPPPPPTTPDAAVEESKRLRDRQRDARASSGGEVGDLSGRVREVDGKRFRREADGRWVDEAWDGLPAEARAAVTRVEAYGDAWLELSRRGDRVARWLAVGERLLLVVDGTAYEVGPPPAPAGPPGDPRAK